MSKYSTNCLGQIGLAVQRVHNKTERHSATKHHVSTHSFHWLLRDEQRAGAGPAQWYKAGLRIGWSGVRVPTGAGNFSSPRVQNSYTTELSRLINIFINVYNNPVNRGQKSAQHIQENKKHNPKITLVLTEINGGQRRGSAAPPPHHHINQKHSTNMESKSNAAVAPHSSTMSLNRCAMTFGFQMRFYTFNNRSQSLIAPVRDLFQSCFVISSASAAVYLLNGCHFDTETSASKYLLQLFQLCVSEFIFSYLFTFLSEKQFLILKLLFICLSLCSSP
jgi:hypothetical protein